MFMIEGQFVGFCDIREPFMAASLIPTEGGSPIPLDKPIMLIGRNQDCDISLQVSSKISRRHCCIVQCGERFLLRDLGSMNGVRVNAQRVVEAELKPGDEVAVADVEFTFRVEEAKGSARERRLAEVASSESPSPDEPSSARGQDPVPPHQESGEERSSRAYEEPNIPDAEIRVKDDSESEAGFVRV
jgi:pSer/pThr/pTyr-binding forkhead associated (FHA) protein